MHYQLEIVLPPDLPIEESVEKILAPFDENGDDEDYSPSNAFWDFWIIGGRYAGKKLESSLPKDKLDNFYQWLRDEEVKVSSLTMGKQSLIPEHVEKVDQKWTEMFFPDSDTVVACSIFDHSNDQFNNETIQGDIAPLSECLHIKCARVIFAVPHWEDGWSNPQAGYMAEKSYWNGVTHMGTTWDGSIGSARKDYLRRLENMSDGYRAKAIPQDDWLCVTVDYHS